MGRRNWKAYADPLNRGINQQAELVVPGEVADARNVWAPNGKLVSRPGYDGVMRPANRQISATNLTATNKVWVVESSGSYTVQTGAFTATLDPATNDRLYFGITEDPSTAGRLFISLTTANTNNTYWTMEYWNGSEWRFIESTLEPTAAVWFGATQTEFFFVPPTNWEATDVSTATSRYFVRWTLHGPATSAIDFKAPSNVNYRLQNIGEPNLFLPANYLSERRMFIGALDEGVLHAGTTPAMRDYTRFKDPGLGDYFVDNDKPAPATLANIQDDQWVYFSAGGNVAQASTKVTIESSEFVGSLDRAQIESNPLIVGDKAAYSRDYITQAGSFPEANNITFFANRIWAAYKFRIVWSAPYPFHRVFPDFNWANVGDDDNSEITAIASLGEQLVIFKRNSIYIMADAGQTAFATGKFAFIRVVSGVGCVARGSVRAINGRLVFLGADGIYEFNGTPDIRRITRSQTGADRLIDFISRINAGTVAGAAAANWRRRSCYLLAVPIDDAATNDHMICWDYKRDSFWVWDNIPAKMMFEGESFDEPDVVYFVDTNVDIYRLGLSRLDNQAGITSYVTTHRVGVKSHSYYRFREAEVLSDNKTESLSVAVYRNDDEIETASGTISLTDSEESDWSDTITDGTTEWSQKQRRHGRIGFRVDGDHFQVKLTHSTVGQPLEVSSLKMSLMEKSRR